jgi:serine O-acetyltransferase
MKQAIMADLFRYEGLTSIWKGKRLPGFKYTHYLRKCSYYGKWSFFGIIYRLLLRKYSYKFGFQIPPSTQIGAGLYLGHFGIIVISHASKIGRNCNIGHNVTIGRVPTGDKQGSPNIGNRVWIGTGAVLVGNIDIGNNVLIAPNAFVNFNVPSNSIVIGNPAKVLPKDDAVAGYINYVLDES